MFKKAFPGALAGAVVGAIVVAALLATDTRAHNKKPYFAEAMPSEEAAHRFEADWRRMKEATFSVDSTFVRKRPDGNEVRFNVYLAQKPPKSLRISSGTTTLQEPGKTTVCTKDTDNARGSCRSAATSVTYEQDTDKEVAAVRSLVAANGMYSVAQTDRHCYRLQSTTASETSTWGQLATFCFDEDTGALQRSEIHKGDVVDTTTAGTIFKKVDDKQFVDPNAPVDLT